jgi:hypothetical protein
MHPCTPSPSQVRAQGKVSRLVLHIVVIEGSTVIGRSAGGAILLAESKPRIGGKNAIAWGSGITVTAAVGNRRAGCHPAPQRCKQAANIIV